MTRLDKLKTMTAEEFAHWLNSDFMRCDWCYSGEDHVDPITSMCTYNGGDCDICVAKWLKEELE
jgi:hypothetical protein